MSNHEDISEAAWEAHELAIKMRGILDLSHGPAVSVPYADLERMVVLTSFIAGFRLAEHRSREGLQ